MKEKRGNMDMPITKASFDSCSYGDSGTSLLGPLRSLTMTGPVWPPRPLTCRRAVEDEGVAREHGERARARERQDGEARDEGRGRLVAVDRRGVKGNGGGEAPPGATRGARRGVGGRGRGCS